MSDQSSNDKSLSSSALDRYLGYQLRRISSAAMGALAEQLSTEGARVTEYTVMSQIAENPGITSSEIGRILDIKRANMTPLISSLVDRGLVASKRKDGRSQALQLSASGKRKFSQLSAVVEAFEQDLAAPLNDAEQQQLLNLLSKVWQPIARLKDADN